VGDCDFRGRLVGERLHRQRFGFVRRDRRGGVRRRHADPGPARRADHRLARQIVLDLVALLALRAGERDRHRVIMGSRPRRKQAACGDAALDFPLGISERIRPTRRLPMLAKLVRRVRPDRRGPRTGPQGKVLKTAPEKVRAKGHGNWACWDGHELDQLSAAAARWAVKLPPGDRYWLGWNIHDDWCRLQQRLVLEVGWTPVVGVDCSQVPEPTILPGAIRIDFQAGLPAPDMWMHFPMELVFDWVDRLAFWHSDVVLPL